MEGAVILSVYVVLVNLDVLINCSRVDWSAQIDHSINLEWFVYGSSKCDQNIKSCQQYRFCGEHCSHL